MPQVTCDQERTDGVTLVTCRLESNETLCVTVEPTHDPPIWPPRRQGVPAAGWAETTWTGVVDADRTRGLGYATPADPTDDPVRVVDVAPPDACDDSITAREVVRSLGDPSPARDAVSTATDGHGGTPETDDTSADLPTDEAQADPARDERPTAAASEGGSAALAGDDAPATPASDERLETAGGPTTPVAGAARLDAIDRRLDTAATLASVSTPEEARDAVADAGGLAAVRSLVEHLEADRAYLERVSGRTDDLLARADATTVPLDALERLA